MLSLCYNFSVKKFLSFVISFVMFFPLSVSAFIAVGPPFGGTIISAVPCTCSPYTRITIMTARGAISLDYPYFSQKYLSFNTPKTTYLLGFYRFGPSCLDYEGVECSPRKTPAQGTITPILGSSPR